MTTTMTFILPTAIAQVVVAFTNDFTYFDAEAATTIGSTTRVLISSDGPDAEEELSEYVKRLTAFTEFDKF